MNAENGWVKIYRTIQNESWYTRPSISHLAIHLILSAQVTNKKIIFAKKEMPVNRGQLVTSLKKLSEETGLSYRQIRTALNVLAECQFATSKTTNKFRVITICNYDKNPYENFANDKQNDKQETNKRQTKTLELLSDNQFETPKNYKNIRNIKNNTNTIYSLDAQKILDYLNDKKGSKYIKKDEIIARLKDGYTFNDCVKVIENKLNDPYFQENPKYLNPVTLFRKSHFDNYLNETPSKKIDNFELYRQMKEEEKNSLSEMDASKLPCQTENNSPEKVSKDLYRINKDYRKMVDENPDLYYWPDDKEKHNYVQ